MSGSGRGVRLKKLVRLAQELAFLVETPVIPHTLTLLIGRTFFPKINQGVLIGIRCGAGPNTPSLLATQKAAESRSPRWDTPFLMPSETS